MTPLETPHRPAHEAPSPGSAFTGTTALLRLYARRDRVVAPLWILLLSVPLSTVYVGSIQAVYPTSADRAAFAASIMASPAQRALYGRIFDDGVGATGLWKAGMFGVLIAVASILTVVRHTRADEETGRSELLGSMAVGRYASLSAALLLAGGASVLTGVIGFAGLATLDIPVAGSLAFSSALAGTGLVFAAVAAVTAQLSASARFARSAAFGVLAAAFTLRAAGDVNDSASGLPWASPLGWALAVRPFAGDRFWVLALPLAATTTLIVVAYWLLAHRDVGAGLTAERRGAPIAGAALRGPLGLTWRLDRNALLGWTAGLVVYALVIGSVTDGIGGEIGDSAAAREVVSRLGGTDAIEEAFLAVAFTMLGMVAAAFAISLVLRLHQEESSHRTETVLAGASSRTRWLAAHLAITLGGSAAALLVAGLVAGVAYGYAAGDVEDKLPAVVGTAAVQLPAVWLPAAVTVTLYGLVPRFTPVAWGVLVAFVAMYLLGSLANSTHWLVDLEPFTHVPRVVSGDFSAVPLGWLLVIDAVLIAFGVVAFRRRDLRQ